MASSPLAAAARTDYDFVYLYSSPLVQLCPGEALGSHVLKPIPQLHLKKELRDLKAWLSSTERSIRMCSEIATTQNYERLMSRY